MSDIERIEQRLSALERAVVDGSPEVPALEDRGSLAADLETAVERLEAHDRRLADLEGRVDALDGAVGGVGSVDEAVERQANAALAAVDRLEYRIDGLEQTLEEPHDRSGSRSRSELGDGGMAERAATTETTDDRNEREAGRPSADATGAAGGSGERPGVERTVEAIVSTADDGDRKTPIGPGSDADDRSPSRAADDRSSDSGRSSDDPLSEGEVDGAAAADGAAATDEASGTTGLLGSIRARLP